MKIIETTFERLPRERLEIGFEGENLRATVRIDCASVFAEYPNATPSLIVKPLFADAYPVVVDRNGTYVDWLITSEILSFTGDGEIQLVFYKGEVICKSAVSKIRVSRSLQVTGEMPDPVVQWIENANRKLAEVDAQIVELEGMVDTATDAATRAEQSASTASAKAEQAAGSAATATEKATEATNAAGTATAKAAEAALSATQARNSAMSAANSESGATAKAAEAAQSAQTAAQKAEQITEAARIATGKAGEASASATAAQASEISAAESADDALSAEVGANAAKRAAETSATQAATSAQSASTAAQTATQKATEASQSATNAAASATNAATSAETASTKAGEAAQSAQAVEETAEQLADSLEQIEQNTQDIAELDERKANIDGYYPDMTVGNAEQLNSSKFVENSEPYTLRISGGTSDIGNREYLDAVVGGTVAWNQMVRDEASENNTDFAPIVTVTDAVEDAAGVKVKIEPVQDLHGYDHPWPAGGGKNLFENTASTTTMNGVTFTVNDDGTVSASGTATADVRFDLGYWTATGETVIFNGCPGGGGTTTYRQFADYIGPNAGTGVSATPTAGQKCNVRIQIYNGYTANNLLFKPMIRLASETDGTFAPYSNICPISGFEGLTVFRSGANYMPPIPSDFGNLQPLIDYGRDITFTGYTISMLFSGSFANRGAGFIVFTDSEGNSIFLTPQEFKTVSGNEPLASNTIYSNVAIKLSSSATIKVQKILLRTWPAFTGAQFDNVMLNQGSTAIAYEPYSGNTYDITLPTEAGTVYGGELTVNADGSGSLVVDRASVDMGELSWMFMNVNGTQRLCSVSLNPLPLTPRSDYYPPEIICSAYKVVYVSQLPNNHYSISMGFSGYGYGNRLIVNDETITTVEQATEKLSGQTCVYKLLAPITYTLTASQIRTLLGTNNIWADTGDLALTYTGTDEHLTLENGKKYLSRISGTDSMLLGSGQEITAAKGTDNVFDLTQMFGTAVADYVYGQGASFFRKWFPGARYPYNAGELKHVEGLQSHDMFGFNVWDEEWELGSIKTQDGKNTSSTQKIRSKNFISCIPSTRYGIYYSNYGADVDYVYFYDSDQQFIGYKIYRTNNDGTTGTYIFETLENCRYIRFIIKATSYHGGLCVHLAHNGTRNGEYEPYEKHTYPLDSTVVLRGIPKVGANGVYWDGDRYLPDGTVERRYGEFIIDGNAVSSFATSSAGIKYVSGNLSPAGEDGTTNKIISGNYSISSSGTVDKSVRIVGGAFYVYDNEFTSINDAKSKLNVSPVRVVYERSIPTTETAQPYHSTQWVSDWGTEEFVSTGLVPVGHETRYPANLRDKLQHLPDAASGNGSYLITQTDGQMVLTPFPAPPSSAGNYVLKATVTGGVATYTWEVAT